MAPQLSAAELDFLRKLVGQGLCPVEAHTRLAARLAALLMFTALTP